MLWNNFFKQIYIYLSKNHSNYCNEVNKIIPDNLVDINLEISKKDHLIKYMEEYYDKNPLINLKEFSKEALNTYIVNLTLLPHPIFFSSHSIRNYGIVIPLIKFHPKYCCIYDMYISVYLI